MPKVKKHHQNTGFWNGQPLPNSPSAKYGLWRGGLGLHRESTERSEFSLATHTVE